jgi:muramidase (phage lysozyme)
MTRDELLEHARHPNVRAMLDAIAACEGTAGPLGYRTQFGGGTFDSFADHPKQVIERTLAGKPLASSAAGRYQFLARTWGSLVEQYGFPSFEPQWQDAGAVALIEGRGALEDVIAGRLEAAVRKLAPEWASLPGAPYGQPTKHITFVRDAYLRAGGRLDGGAPVEARTHPNLHTHAPNSTEFMPVYPDTIKATPMAPVLTALLPSLIGLIPELGKLFGSGSDVASRNLKAAERVAEIVVAATAAPNLQGAVETMTSNPDARNAARLAVQAVWFELEPGDGGGVAGARKAAEAASERPGIAGLLAGINQLAMDIAVVGGGGYMLWTVAMAPGTSSDIRSLIIGSVAGYIAAVVQFRYGSSVSSRQKDSALVRELGQR